MKYFLILILALSCFAGINTDKDSVICRITKRPNDTTSFNQVHIQGRSYFDSYGKNDYGQIDFNLWKIGEGYIRPAWLKYNGGNGTLFAPYFNSSKQSNFYGLKVAHCTTSVVAVIDSAEIRTGLRMNGLFHSGPNLSSYGAVKSMLINPDMDSSGINTILQIAPVIRQWPHAVSGGINNITMEYIVPVIDTLTKIHDLYGLIIGGAQFPVSAECTSYTAIVIGRELNANSNCHIGIGIDSTPPGQHSIYDVSSYPSYFNGKIGLQNTNPDWQLDMGGDIIKAAKFGAVLPLYIMPEAINSFGLNAYYDDGWKCGGGSSGNWYGSKVQSDGYNGKLLLGVSGQSAAAGGTYTFNKDISIDYRGYLDIPLGSWIMTDSSRKYLLGQTGDTCYLGWYGPTAPLKFSQTSGTVIMNGGAEIGTQSTNYSKFESDGSLVFNGNATVSNDVQFSISAGKVPAANYPTYETFTTNTREYSFAVDDYIDLVSNEVSHGWKEGTNGNFHLHIATKAANNTGSARYAKFSIYIAWAGTDSVFKDTTLTNELTIPDGTTALKSMYLDMNDLVLNAYTIGTQMKPRVKRIAATGGTEYSGNIFILQCGVHLEEDMVGSRTETAK